LEGGREKMATKKVLRRDLTSEKLDQGFRKLNSGRIRANARLVKEKLEELKGGVRKEIEKDTVRGLRMMRADEETGDGSRLPLV